MWWIARKKGGPRWIAYELSEKPEVKRGYEMRGPFKSLAAAMAAAMMNQISA